MPQGSPGLPAPYVVALLDVPAAHIGEQFAVALTLENSRGEAVTIPGPVPGTQQAPRIQQLVVAGNPSAVGVPMHRMPGRVNVVINIQPGLPVDLADAYDWVLEVEGHRDPQWRARFWVLPAPSAGFGPPCESSPPSRVSSPALDMVCPWLTTIWASGSTC